MQEKKNKNAEISARLRLVIDYLDITANVFAQNLGYARAQTVYDIINGKSAPSFDFFNKFANAEYSEVINLEWLLTGKGEMLKKNFQENDPPKPPLKTDPPKTDSDPPKRPPKTEKTNVFHGMSDEEVEHKMSIGFQRHLLEMYESGRAAPAIEVKRYQEEIKRLITQVAKLEYQLGEMMLKQAVSDHSKREKGNDSR